MTIGSGLQSIGASAFYDCGQLVNLTIASTNLTTIGKHAFQQCYLLASPLFLPALVVLEFETFKDCDALTEVTFGDALVSIATSAFYSCDSLSRVTIGSGLQSIGTRAFYYCGQLVNPVSYTHLTLPTILLV